MADMSIDTSSYPKPAVPQNALDIAGKLGGLRSQALTIQQQQQNLQSGAIGIDQQKLELINSRFATVTKDLSSLLNKKNVSADDVAQHYGNLVKLGFIPQQLADTAISQIPQNASTDEIKSHIADTISRGQSVVDAINWNAGQRSDSSNGQTTTPGVFSANPNVGFHPIAAPIQNQNPPGTLTINSQNQPQLLGAQPIQLPIDSSPAQGGFPGQFNVLSGGNASTAPNPSPAPNPLLVPGSRLPVIAPRPNVSFTSPVTNKDQAQVPRGPVTGLAPGVGEAATATGTASGGELAKARIVASNFQREVFPLAKAIPALEALGTKGTGPGTETLNQIKSFLLSNVPGLTAEKLASVKDYDEANKYLVDFVNQTGNSGTNDKLAAAFSGNPSTHISNAAAVDVAKSALSLRRMQQAQQLEFEQSGLRDDQFLKWRAQRTNELDPRAFGVDMMTPDAKKKLSGQLAKASKIEKENFENSLQLAQKFNFLPPVK